MYKNSSLVSTENINRAKELSVKKIGRQKRDREKGKEGETGREREKRRAGKRKKQ